MRRALHLFGCLASLAICQCERAPVSIEAEADGGERERHTPANRSADAAIAPPASPAHSAGAGAPAATSGGSGGSGGARAHADAEPDAGQDELDAGATPAADSGVPAIPTEDSSCLKGPVSYAAAGPFGYEARVEGKLKLWLPKLPPNCKAPIVHFANGTGATCSNYQGVLERLASHGFIAVCTESPMTGDGVPGMHALETVLTMYPELAAHKLGSAGQEAGGQGALLTLQQAETSWSTRARYAGLAFMPASGHGAQPPGGGTWLDAYAAVKSPVLMMSGTADALVSEAWVGQGFDALSDSIEAYWYSGVDVVQLPLPIERMQQLSIPWFRWKLLDDAQACAYFKQLPDGELWDLRASQHAQACP